MASNPDIQPFTGYVETTSDALRLIYAALRGVIPRTTRWLSHSERRNIKSGSVFIFSVEESGIKCWTDCPLWSPPRIVGNFLVYREINGKISGRDRHLKPYPKKDFPMCMLPRKSCPDRMSIRFKGRGAGDQGTLKVGGLIKKAMTVTIDATDLHLVSYYTSEDIRSGKLKGLSSRADIMSLRIPPHIFQLTNVRVPPMVGMAEVNKPRLIESESIVHRKVEDRGDNILENPTWSSGSPTSPIKKYFSRDSLCPSNLSGGSGMFASLRQDVNRSQATNTLSSYHSISPRREGIENQLPAWPSLESQTGRSQSQDFPTSSTNGWHPERPQVRPNRLYENGPLLRRRNHEGSQSSHWQLRDMRDNIQEIHRSSSHPSNSLPPSPTLPFADRSTHLFREQQTDPPNMVDVVEPTILNSEHPPDNRPPRLCSVLSHPLRPLHGPRPQSPANRPRPSMINHQRLESHYQVQTPQTASMFGVPDVNALVDSILARAPAGNIILFIGNGNVTGNTYRNLNNTIQGWNMVKDDENDGDNK